MNIGKNGIKLSTYAITAFVLALLGQTLLCALLLAFVLISEKDEWAVRQCMQAFFLTFASVLIALATALLMMLGAFLTAVTGGFGAILLVLFMLAPGVLSVLVLVFTIMGLVRVVKGGEANIPILSKLAYRAYGKMPPAPMPAPYGQPYYGQPMPGAPYPPQPMAPGPVPGSYAPPPAPAAPAAPSAPAAPVAPVAPVVGSPFGAAPAVPEEQPLTAAPLAAPPAEVSPQSLSDFSAPAEAPAAPETPIVPEAPGAPDAEEAADAPDKPADAPENPAPPAGG